jgi:competence protein ComEC
MRAALMGFGALIALLMDRRVRNLGSLILVATILLLFNPLWIWDLGFQLSFLATLGLIVTAPVLQRWLDWLPLAIATAVAIPIAAFVWTLPLLMQVFSVVASYSIVTNIITVPLIVIISLGGMISAIAALFVPVAGSAIAWLLYYPIHWLIAIVTFFTQLPGSSVAVGKLPLGLMVAIYALMGLVWFSSWWQKRWWLVGLFALTLLIVPLTYQQLTRVQVTVLAANQEPVVVIQDQGKVALINSGDADTATYTVLPFLKQQGINLIDLAVALTTESSPTEGWWEIADNLAIKDFFCNCQTKESPQIGR